MPNDTCRYSPDNGIGLDLFCDDGARGHNGIVAYFYPLQNSGVGSDPYVTPENDGGRVGAFSVLWIKSVIERGEYYVVSYLTVVADEYASVILKMATGIDENPLAYVDIFPKIGVKRREYPERRIDFIPEKP